MKLLTTILLGILTVPLTALGQTADFAGAQWIALEQDSTILFPHVHLLKAKSPKGQSLKRYQLPVLEREFQLEGRQIRRAWADVCGLGQYELFVNGKKVGRHFLDPGWTMFNKRLLYNTFDLTEQLSAAGRDISLRVMLGGGMYDIPLQGYHKMGGSCGAPKLLLALHIDYADGQRQDIVSDSTWTASASPVTYSSIYGGESYDATLTATPKPAVVTHPHWDVPLVKQADHTRLIVKQQLPMTRLKGLGIPDSTCIYDTGQNCSGIVRLSVRGPQGSRVTLRPAEILRDGAVYQRCMPGYAWTYTLRGDQEGESWQPQFSYTGFRYVEVKADEGVEVMQLTGLHTSADVTETGHFECSDTLLNSIYTLIDWAISSNLASITTDCPTREKLGWQEQNHLMAYSMMYRYDMQELMNKIVDDLADSQHDDGAIPTIAPEYTLFAQGSGFEDTPEWGASFILCPYYNYIWYGDDSAMRRHYDAMKRYIDYLQSRTQGNILDYGLGDWFDVGPNRPGVAQLTSVAFSATAMYHYELCVMSNIAHLLGKDDDAQRFSRMADNVKQAFNARFWNQKLQQYEQGSQTASAMALFMQLTTDANRSKVLQSLVDDIITRMASAKAGEALVTAGDVGYRYVLQALREGGRSDVIWQMNRRNDLPGYAYQLRQGATALTESWQAYDNVSNNHLMLGHLMEWLFQAPGGIRQAEGSVAWRHIVIEPQMLGTLTWAKASIQSPKGLIACHWTASADRSQWTVNVTIPQGADAEVRLPDGRHCQVGAGDHTFSSDKAQGQAQRQPTVTWDSKSLMMDGRRVCPVMGEIHYSRIPADEWATEVRKMKEGGVTIIATYVFWNHIEEQEGIFRWDGQRSLRRFLEVCQQQDMPVVLRLGPFCHGEVRNGGIPDWVFTKGCKLREANSVFLGLAEKLYRQIFTQVQGLQWKDGGPVIAAQFDNEYRGRGEYLMALKNIALQAGFDLPFYTRTGWPELRTPVPFGEMLPLYGDYADGFWDKDITEGCGNYYKAFNFKAFRSSTAIGTDLLGKQEENVNKGDNQYPYFTCELGGGMATAYHRRPYVYPEDAYSMALVKLGSGSNLLGYYMYHGGTNPEGVLHTLNECQTSPGTANNDLPVMTYDFQAPLGEYGQTYPHYYRLRPLHLFMHDWGETLAPMEASFPAPQDLKRGQDTALRWSVRSGGFTPSAASVRSGGFTPPAATARSGWFAPPATTARSAFIFVNNYERFCRLSAKKNVRLSACGVTLPRLTIPSGCMAIFPVNIDSIRYATAQLVARRDGKTYLMQIPGIPTTIAMTNGKTLKNLKPLGTDTPVYASLYLLTPSDAEHLFLSPLTHSTHSLPFTKLQSPGPLRPITKGKAKVAEAPSEQDWQHAAVYRITIPTDSAQLVSRPLVCPAGSPLLTINYRGDCARLYANGRLIADNFYYGRPFLYALWRLPKGCTELELRILPLQPDAPIYLPREADKRPGEQVNSITISE